MPPSNPSVHQRESHHSALPPAGTRQRTLPMMSRVVVSNPSGVERLSPCVMIEPSAPTDTMRCMTLNFVASDPGRSTFNTMTSPGS
jgi:hypothetical protein